MGSPGLRTGCLYLCLALLGALILLGVIFYLVYVGGLLSPAASSYSNYSRYGQDYNQYYQNYNGQAR